MASVAKSVHVPENALEKYMVSALPPMRLFNMFAGSAFLLAAIGMWITPGATWDSGLMLFKLMITIALLIAGFALIAPARRRIPEVQLDPRAERLELVVRNEFGRVVRSQSYEYRELSEIDVRDGVFIARDHQGRNVVELPLTQQARELEKLRTALGPTFARSA